GDEPLVLARGGAPLDALEPRRGLRARLEGQDGLRAFRLFLPGTRGLHGVEAGTRQHDEKRQDGNDRFHRSSSKTGSIVTFLSAGKLLRAAGAPSGQLPAGAPVFTAFP